MFQASLLVLCGAILRLALSGGPFEAPFGCAGLTLNDQDRTGALNFLNRIRSSVALGQFQAQNLLSSASNMDQLAWNCDLERLAQTAVRNCPQNARRIGAATARNYQLFGQGSSAFELQFPIEAAILKWSDISTLMWPADNVYDGNRALRPFANMIRANTASVGCSSATCGGSSAAACVFSSRNVRRGDQVYMSGMPCQNDLQCNRFNPGFCENGLCVNAIRPTTTTFTTTTTTTTKRKSTECPSTAFSSTFREVALGIHNNFRSLVARGRAVNAEHPGEFAPPASRMDLLEYDCQAEQLALNHVRSCDRQPSPATARPGYSENIHVLATTETDLLGAIQNAIGTFTNELGENGIPSNMLLTPHVFQRTQRTVTRVSKVLWGSNRFVGCATQLCNGFYFTSCMYRDPVNVVGASIYSIGAVCSACPGSSNCDGAVGLCSY